MEIDKKLSIGSRVSGFTICHTPETNGKFKIYDYTGTIQSQRDDTRLGRINYIRLDVPIPRYFSDGWTLVHFANYDQPLTSLDADTPIDGDLICAETIADYTNLTPEEIIQVEKEGLFTEDEIEHMKKCVFKENSMIEAEMLSCDDLLAASEMYRSLRDNTFYRKQEEAAAVMGFTIKYI